MCFDNNIFRFDTILRDKLLPFDTILCETIRFGTILCSVKRFDKEVRYTNYFDTKFHEEDELVNCNNNRCKVMLECIQRN